MENQRLFLFVALSIIVMLLFNAWQDQYGPKPVKPQPTVSAPSDTTTAPDAGQPVADAPPATDTPAAQALPTPQAAGTSAPSAAPGVPGDVKDVKPTADTISKRVHVVTDLLDVEIDSKGADIKRAALLKYPDSLENPEVKVQLLDDRMPNLMITQTGLQAKKGYAPSVHYHHDFDVDNTEYRLAAGADKLDVVFTHRNPAGLTVIKTLTFKRNSYTIDVNLQVQNNTGREWVGSVYRQLKRTKPNDKNQSAFVYTFTGGVVSTPENKYEKIQLDEMVDWKSEQGYTKGGWAAMSQHYFLGVVIPDAQEFDRYYTSAKEDSHYIIGAQSSEFTIANGASQAIPSRFYIGPKEQSRLGDVTPHLDLAVDFGVLTLLAQPLFWLLAKFHEWFGNWGVAIILVTLCVKLLFYKLSEAAYRSMANMRRFQPRIQQLRERYINDKQRMSQAMMELYKKEKINPLGGCLPMLVQIPVFISLYWVLLESVELRQADFIFWLNDLSVKDPFYVLPVLMGASMLIQQKLNPAPMDPMQQKVMQVLPIVFTLFFAFFPAGLVLYWVVNSILSIAQQWYITRKIELAAAAPASSNKST